MDRRGYLGGIITAAVPGLAGCGGSGDTSTADDPETESSTRIPTPTDTATPRMVGDTYVTASNVALTVSAVTIQSQTDTGNEKQGQTVLATIEAENRAESTQSSPEYLNWHLRARGSTFGGRSVGSYGRTTSELDPGETGSGDVGFAVSGDLRRDDIEDVYLLAEDDSIVRWSVP